MIAEAVVFLLSHNARNLTVKLVQILTDILTIHKTKERKKTPLRGVCSAPTDASSRTSSPSRMINISKYLLFEKESGSGVFR